MEKTNYEKKVESGELESMNGLDVAMLDMLVCDVINRDCCATEEQETLLDLMDEIEYIYKDDSETLELFMEVIKKEPID